MRPGLRPNRRQISSSARSLVDADLLPLALREIDELAGNRQPEGLLEQRAHLAAQGTAWHVGTPESVLDHGIVRPADLQRTLARAHVQARFAVEFAFQNQLAD
jgi:hypothetical protein